MVHDSRGVPWCSCCCNRNWQPRLEQHCQLETIVADSCLSAGTIAPLMGCGGGEPAPFVWQCRHGRWLIGHDKPRGQWGRKRRSAGIIGLCLPCLKYINKEEYFKYAFHQLFFFFFYEYIIRNPLTKLLFLANVRHALLAGSKSHYWMGRWANTWPPETLAWHLGKLAVRIFHRSSK